MYAGQGLPYRLDELFGEGRASAGPSAGGTYVTLRLTSAMYHRFHAPHDVTRRAGDLHLSGDTWNVNPIALARVERLFCRNERALLRMRLEGGGHRIALVPVAAVLVASLRLHFLPGVPYPRQRGARETLCHAALSKGQELGWFEHGSTVLVFTPPGFALMPGIGPGSRVRMGQALMSLPSSA